MMLQPVPKSISRRLVSFLLLVVTAISAAAAQEPAYRSDSRLVRVDVSVLDRTSAPVRDLSVADFRISERGRPLVIRTFEAVSMADGDARASAIPVGDLPTQADAPSPSDSGQPRPASGVGRVILLLMDDDMTPPDPRWAGRAKAIAHALVDRMSPDDMSGVQFTRVSSRELEFTSNRAQLRRRIETYSAGGYLALPPRNPNMDDEVPRYRRSVGALGNAAEAVAGLTGMRKILVYIGPGVPVRQDAGQGGYHGDFSRALVSFFREAERANVVVYAFDPTGMDGLEDYAYEKFILGERMRPRLENRGLAEALAPARDRARSTARWALEFSSAIAGNTGGRALVRSDGIEQAISLLFADTSFYYLIGVEPPGPSPDDRFHEVDVSVTRPDVEIRARRGYYYGR